MRRSALAALALVLVALGVAPGWSPVRLPKLSAVLARDDIMGYAGAALLVFLAGLGLVEYTRSDSAAQRTVSICLCLNAVALLAVSSVLGVRSQFSEALRPLAAALAWSLAALVIWTLVIRLRRTRGRGDGALRSSREGGAL
jgi:hypothetical protein